MRSLPLIVLAACSGGGRAPAEPAAETPASTAAPSEPGALQRWLADRPYRDWAAESAPHESAGPHGGKVRTFLSSELAASLAAGTDHPVGATAVKELYGDGDTVTGWAVSIKLVADSGDGEGWYWFETFTTDPDGAPDFEGAGEELCSGCHLAGEDYVLVPFPLR